MFPYVRESARDDFMSDDVRRLSLTPNAPFELRPPSKADLATFENYGSGNEKYLERTRRAANREFNLIVSEFRNQIY